MTGSMSDHVVCNNNVNLHDVIKAQAKCPLSKSDFKQKRLNGGLALMLFYPDGKC